MLHFLFALVLLSTIAVSESSTPIYCPPLGQVNSSAAQNLASSTPSPTLNSTQNQTVSGDEQDDVKLPELYIVIAGSLAFLVTFPFAVYHIPRVALESTGAVLIGSCLMVLLGVLTQSDVFEILGKRGNLTTLLLLFGMMLICQYLEREGLVHLVLNLVLPPRKQIGTAAFLFRVMVLTYVLSALFTNDATCVLITPLILRRWRQAKRDELELESLCFAIATTADISSSQTVFGNPQLALISSTTATDHFSRSRLDLARTLLFFGPPSLVASMVNFLMLMGHFHIRKFWRERSKENSHERRERTRNNLMEVSSQRISHTREVSNGHHSEAQEADNSSNKIQETPLTHSLDKPEQAVSEVDKLPATHEEVEIVEEGAALDGQKAAEAGEDATEEQKTVNIGRFLPDASTKKRKRRIAFRILLLVAIVALIAMLIFSAVTPPSLPKFDIGLTPVFLGTIILSLDAILLNERLLPTLRHVEFSILVLFAGIFVWLSGLNRTRIPQFVWSALGLGKMNLLEPGPLVLFSVFITLTSNIFCNVPLTILVLEQLKPCADQQLLVLQLAWITTVAGNLTLFGAVANLIVSQQASRVIQEWREEGEARRRVLNDAQREPLLPAEIKSAMPSSVTTAPENSKSKPTSDEDTRYLEHYQFNFVRYLTFGPLSTCVTLLIGILFIHFWYMLVGGLFRP